MPLRSGIILVVVAAAVVVVLGQQGSDGPTPRYSSKTGYETSFEPGTQEKAQRSRDWRTIAADVGETSLVNGCTPVGVYAVHRHGLRYPSDGDIETYDDFLARMKSTGVSDEFAYLLNITDNRYPISLEGKLHPVGFDEMVGLGSRIKTRLPELVDDDGDLDGFSFQGTYRQRTIDSAHGYITGLLGPGAVCNITKETTTQDTLTCSVNATGRTETVVVDQVEEGDVDILLKFYESCTNYITSVDDNDTAVIEATQFGDGPEIAAVLESLAAKLAPNGTQSWNMTKDELEVMHHMCGYETGFYGNSPWCNLFTDAESLVVEYWLDLDQYWAEGYGHEINYEIACPLVDDIVKFMESVRENGGPRGQLKFGHSSTIQPLLAILDLYRDTPTLLADNYPESVDRVWRSGRIAPMSSHLAFNVFQCPATSGASSSDRVLVLHNELPIKVGDCENFFCDFDDVASHLTTASDGCRWDDLCGTDDVYPGAPVGAANRLSSLSWFFTSVILFAGLYLPHISTVA